ncbi:MAG: hypothetical protein AAGB16_07435 [Pseudomonadota bacterium]
MKRLLLAFGLLALPVTAQASPEEAQIWGQDAAKLEIQTSQLIKVIDMGRKTAPSEDYILGLSRFGRSASNLAVWNDRESGPADLGCIFRGMATESETQTLSLLEQTDALEARDTLKRLESMFSDAQLIAKAAAAQTPTPTLQRRHQSETCPMDAEATRAALR